MSWFSVPTPNRGRLIASRTQEVGMLLAEGFAWKMDENYSYARGGARSGRPDPKTNRPRSVRGEFPQEQTGTLRSAIFHELLTNYSDAYVYAKAGLDVDVSKNADALLEYLMYIEADTSSRSGREGLTMTAESNETHESMLRHLRQYLDPTRFVVPG